MKIRSGFVSNSSSSSFLIYGIRMEQKELIKKLEKNNIEISEVEKEELDYFLEKRDKELFVSYGPDEDWSEHYLYIGKSWSSIKNDQTGAEFKKEVEEKLKNMLGEEIKCSTLKEAWYNG